MESMSVFGGDSWAREAPYRKRRVDDWIIEGIDSSAYKKLPNGKFTCLVSPQRPVLNTILMLSGSSHRATTSKLKERELSIKDERNKRIAFSDCSTAVSSAASCGQRSASANKLLIQWARKAASEILNGSSPQGSTFQKSQDIRSYDSSKMTESPSTHDKGASNEVGAVCREIVGQQFDFQERWERELKLTSAGWNRDCHGRWFKDENVGFDSDEEDPNVCLGL